MNHFHGFYYTGKNNALCGLGLSKNQSGTMTKIIGGDFQRMSYESYWKQIARYVNTHAPQGYVAFNGTAIWLIGNCGCIMDKNISQADQKGVNVVQFCRDKTIWYQWYTEVFDEDAIYDPIYDLVYTPWDWLLEGQGDHKMFKLNAKQLDELGEVMDWTNDLHIELEKRWPSEQYCR